MKAGRLLKIMRRDVAYARRLGVEYIEWRTHAVEGPVCVATITVADLRSLAARLAKK